jgi:cytochrome c biogenesis protein CcmG/thiol:disulfide interchange protein DsbE
MLYRILAIIFIILATLGYGIYSKKSLEGQIVSDSNYNSVLASLPSALFTDLDEKVISIDDLYQKESIELLIVHFWGTWCAPCEAELPELLTFIKRFQGRPGIKFLLVAANDEALKVKKHLKKISSFSQESILWLLDNQNVHRDLFGTTRVPETYVFSSDKTTLRKYMGPQEWNKSSFFQTFDELLQISNRKL